MGREKLDSVGIHDSYHHQPVLVGTVVSDHPTSEAPINIPLVAFGGRVAGGVEVRGLVPAGTGPIGFTTYRSWVFRGPIAHHTQPEVTVSTCGSLIRVAQKYKRSWPQRPTLWQYCICRRVVGGR